MQCGNPKGKRAHTQPQQGEPKQKQQYKVITTVNVLTKKDVANRIDGLPWFDNESKKSLKEDKWVGSLSMDRLKPVYNIGQRLSLGKENETLRTLAIGFDVTKMFFVQCWVQ